MQDINIVGEAFTVQEPRGLFQRAPACAIAAASLLRASATAQLVP
jgi:hypothetical protein